MYIVCGVVGIVCVLLCVYSILHSTMCVVQYSSTPTPTPSIHVCMYVYVYIIIIVLLLLSIVLYTHEYEHCLIQF